MRKSIYSVQYERLLAQLVQARRAADMTQMEVAKRLRRHQSFVSKYEGGERRLDVIEFMNVCDILGADPFEILRAIRR